MKTSSISALLLAMFLLGGCTSSSGPDDVSDARFLELAYKKNSLSSLDRFFREWEEASQPIMADELAALPDSVREAYLLFEAFYNPVDPVCERISVEHPHSHIVVQQRLDVQVMSNIDSSWWASYDLISKWTIHDFRPRISIPGKKTLYQRARYDSAFTGFMDQPDYKESEARAKFMRPRIELLPMYSSERWYLVSQPYVSIRFNPDMRRARVLYRIFSGGSSAFYRRTSAGWELEDCDDLHWIVEW